MLPDGMPQEMLTYHGFAEAYGWDPPVVRSLSLEELYWLPVVQQARAKADKIRRDQKKK